MPTHIKGTAASGDERKTLRLLLALLRSAFYDMTLNPNQDGRIQAKYLHEITKLRHTSDSSAENLWNMAYAEARELAMDILPWLKSAGKHDPNDEEFISYVAATAIMLNEFEYDVSEAAEDKTLRVHLFALAMFNSDKGKLWVNDTVQFVSDEGDIDWDSSTKLKAALLKGFKSLHKNIKALKLTKAGIEKLSAEVNAAKKKEDNAKSSSTSTGIAADVTGANGNVTGDGNLIKEKKKKKKKKSSPIKCKANAILIAASKKKRSRERSKRKSDLRSAKLAVMQAEIAAYKAKVDELLEDSNCDADSDIDSNSDEREGSESTSSGDDFDVGSEIDSVGSDDISRKKAGISRISASEKMIAYAIKKDRRKQRRKRKRQKIEDHVNSDDSDSDDNVVTSTRVFGQLAETFATYVTSVETSTSQKIGAGDFVAHFKRYQQNQALLGLELHKPPPFLRYLAVRGGFTPSDTFSQKILEDIIRRRDTFTNAASAFVTHHTSGTKDVAREIALQRCYAALVDLAQLILPHIKKVEHLNVYAETQDIVDYLRSHPFTKDIIDPCELGGAGSAHNYINALSKVSNAVLSGKKKKLAAIKTMQGLVERLAKATGTVATLSGLGVSRRPKRQKFKSTTERPSGTAQWCTKCAARGARVRVCTSHDDASCDADHAARLARNKARTVTGS